MAYPQPNSGSQGYQDTLSFAHVVDVAKAIALLDPNENPITSIFMQFPGAKRPAVNPEFNVIRDNLNPEYFTVNNTTTYATSATSIVVDDASGIRVGDVLAIYTPGSYSPAAEQILVTAISSNTLTVTRAFRFYTGSTRTTIPDESLLHQVGQALGDKSLIADLATGSNNIARTVLQKNFINYCELFVETLPVSEVEKNTEHYGTEDWVAWQRKKLMTIFKRKVENALLWGIPGTGNNAVSASLFTGGHFTTGGLYYWITQTGTDYSYPAAGGENTSDSSISQADFRAWLRRAFRYGSAEKLLFCSDLIAEAIDSWNLSAVRVEAGSEYFGVNTKVYESSHGRVRIIRHKMLENPPLSGLASTNRIGTGGFAFLIDPKDIALRYLQNMDMKLYTNVGVEGDLVKVDKIQGMLGLEVGQPATHAVLRDVTAYT